MTEESWNKSWNNWWCVCFFWELSIPEYFNQTKSSNIQIQRLMLICCKDVCSLAKGLSEAFPLNHTPMAYNHLYTYILFIPTHFPTHAPNPNSKLSIASKLIILTAHHCHQTKQHHSQCAQPPRAPTPQPTLRPTPLTPSLHPVRLHG